MSEITGNEWGGGTTFPLAPSLYSRNFGFLYTLKGKGLGNVIPPQGGG